MTDLEIAEFIAKTVYGCINDNLSGRVLEIEKDGRFLAVIDKEDATQYRLKDDNAFAVDIPELSGANGVAIAQLSLAVGRRLERFERGRKSNASRTAESRQKIAQNAIQSRWSA